MKTFLVQVSRNANGTFDEQELERGFGTVQKSTALMDRMGMDIGRRMQGSQSGFTHIWKKHA